MSRRAKLRWRHSRRVGEGDDIITDGPPRARVFISCGQSKESDEVHISDAIRARLEQLGFDPYVAVAEQTLREIRENIFEQLRKSEYFLFVDFKRELLIRTERRGLWDSIARLFPMGDQQVCRGSLFSHQELSIASFLDITVLAFQERGVKPTDGLLQFLQTNCIPFTDKHTLPNLVADLVRQRGWDPTWRNELILEASPPVVTATLRLFTSGYVTVIVRSSQ